ncbi:unnamed protein product [Rotaria sp. Silwood1]|nr:unnamed protein product [Rotaria sp. Silwood1]
MIITYLTIFMLREYNFRINNLVFYNDEIGEFWYELNLISTNPQKVELSPMTAPVGGNSTQEITIENPLDEQVTFQTIISNNNNFTINTDQDTITVQPKSQAKVNVTFNPSAIGNGNEQKHQSKISFVNDKLGTLKYSVKGVGTKPQKQQSPVIMKSETGVSSTTNIDFQNPSNYPIRCDLSLSSGINNSFRILLDKTEHILIGPREKFHIPIAFCPETLSRHETQLRIIGRLPEGKTWSLDNPEASELSWTYPLQGIAFNWIHQKDEDEDELKVIECIAGERVEQQIEFELNRQLFRFDDRHINMKRNPTAIEHYAIVNETISNQEFVQNSIGIKLLKRDNEKSDIIRFNIVYTPTKFITMDCVLVLTLSTGGQLKYPLRFVKLEIPPDDEIILEAVGLNKVSTIGFRLYSPLDSPIPFEAYFTSNSDRAFTITPDCGELLPANANGTLLKISFCPTVYGRTFNGMLIVNAQDHQWKYVVRGILPHYEPPQNRSSLPSVNSDEYANRRAGAKKRNFILENLQLHQTAVSSPIKGASVLTKPSETTSV